MASGPSGWGFGYCSFPLKFLFLEGGLSDRYGVVCFCNHPDPCKERLIVVTTGLQEKVELHRQVQHLTSELECARKQQEGISEQVSALHSELLNTKTQANHQEKEKVLMKEELELTKQVTLRSGNGPCVILPATWVESLLT